MADRSRHGNYSRGTLSHDKRTIALYGEKEDTGRYFRCWNCGFICNKDRDYNNSVDGISGAHVIDGGYTELNIRLESGYSTEWCKDRDGENIVVTGYIPDVSSGCPFCGSTNYR